MKKLKMIVFFVFLLIFVSACGKTDEAEIEDGLEAEEIEDGLEEKIEDTSVEDNLLEIEDWYTQIWNYFVDFDSYRKTGKDCTGSDIDIEFAYDEFEDKYKLKEEYDFYINSLSEDYEDLKNVWAKMDEQIEKIYSDLQSNGV